MLVNASQKVPLVVPGQKRVRSDNISVLDCRVWGGEGSWGFDGEPGGKALIASNYDESLQLLLPPWLVRRKRRISQGESRNFGVCFQWFYLQGLLFLKTLGSDSLGLQRNTNSKRTPSQTPNPTNHSHFPLACSLQAAHKPGGKSANGS